MAGVFLVFDLGEERSFGKVVGWYLAEKMRLAGNTVFGLVGNKLDLAGSGRKISTAQGKEFAQREPNMFYTEISTLEQTHTAELLSEMVSRMAANYINVEKPEETCCVKCRLI